VRDVQFQYVTGIGGEYFDSALLHGSWDSTGHFSGTFCELPMHCGIAPDGGAYFETDFAFSESDVGNLFRWGVSLRRKEEYVWGISEEVNDSNSKDSTCAFTLSAGSERQVECYRFNWSRIVGAQKVYLPGRQKPAIRFSVWAPNARSVEVVMADLRQLHQPNSSIDPTRSPTLVPIPADQVAGGYISNNGQGILPNWGPFTLHRSEIPGVWQTDLNDPVLADFAQFEHCPYMFRVERDDGSVRYRSDLYSRCQVGFGAVKPEKPETGIWDGRTLKLDGLVSCSAIKDPDHVCREYEEPVYPEQNWLSVGDFWRPQYTDAYVQRPKRVEDLVIYELHIGALGFGKPVNEPGTLKDAVGLLDYLQNLGVNAIELLPMAEFGGGGGGWGYATSHYFAIEYAGGGRDKYKHFVRECHRRGIAVILDVVFNHYAHDADKAEWMYDSVADDRNIYYWYEGHPADYPQSDGQGGYVDNLSTGWAPRYWEPMVRRMFVSALIALVAEFKIDGVRFDQTTSIHAYNVLHANGQPVSEANIFGQKLLREATRALRIVNPEVMIIAEDHSNWPAVTLPISDGGLGFDAAWYADFYHHLIGDTDKGPDYAKILKTAGLGDDRALALDYFAGALATTGANRVVYHESHDEAGNGRFTDRTINVAVNGAPLVGATRATAEARVRVVAGLTLLSAGVPMFLFGEEVGAQRKFLYGKVLENREDLEGLRRGDGANLFNYYASVIRLRLDPTKPALRSQNIDVVYVHNGNRVLAFRRWENDQNFLVIASLSNTPYNQPHYTIVSTKLGNETWREIFNSDAAIYGGGNVGNCGSDLRCEGGKFSCVLPANGLLVFQRT
jgi:1,4-alpha-glucan branching enzyme